MAKHQHYGDSSVRWWQGWKWFEAFINLSSDSAEEIARLRNELREARGETVRG